MTDERKRKPPNKGNLTHGLSKSATYQTWLRLKLTCGPNAKRPCKPVRTMHGRWEHGFSFFHDDMGDAPDNHVLRIRKGSPNGRMHYGPAECEWRPKDEVHYKRVMFDPQAIAHAATIRRSKALAAEQTPPTFETEGVPSGRQPSQTIQTDDDGWIVDDDEFETDVDSATLAGVNRQMINDRAIGDYQLAPNTGVHAASAPHQKINLPPPPPPPPIATAAPIDKATVDIFNSWFDGDDDE